MGSEFRLNFFIDFFFTLNSLKKLLQVTFGPVTMPKWVMLEDTTTLFYLNIHKFPVFVKKLTKLTNLNYNSSIDKHDNWEISICHNFSWRIRNFVVRMLKKIKKIDPSLPLFCKISILRIMKIVLKVIFKKIMKFCSNKTINFYFFLMTWETIFFVPGRKFLAF